MPTISIAEVYRRVCLPLADSILLATARARSAAFWTQDADFAGIAGVKYRAKG